MTAATASRKREIQKLRARQLEGIESQDIFKASVEAKLIGLARGNWWINFQRCGVEQVFIECQNCQATETKTYQCNMKWCPLCNWRITERRRRELEKITAQAKQCKHLVLTQKNFEILTRRKIQATRKALLSLRRQKVMRNLRGGCASLEFTNEGRGWHMHWHLLLDVDWIDIEAVAVKWGKLCGQEFGIVKVKDVRDKTYLAEVCKYVVDGSELARWQPDQILQFVHALRGTRLFTVFGTFKKLRAEVQREIRREKLSAARVCECGCDRFIFGNAESFVVREIRQRGRRS